MNARNLSVVGGGLLLVALAPNGCAVRTAHYGDDAVYPLVGGHEGIACESCHGDFRPGKPEPQSHSCIACHSGDVPAADHFPSRECSGCHTMNTWAEGVYPPVPVPTTPDPETAETADTGIVTGWVHDPVGAHDLCWDCHGSVLMDPTRPTELRPPDHYDDPNLRYSWDCGPCHTLDVWKPAIEHPIRTPHGTYKESDPTDPELWIIGCVPCHTDPTDMTQFQCIDCHLVVNGVAFMPHKGVSLDDPDRNDRCVDCHDDGDVLPE